MLQKTRGIVLHTTRYGESSLIIHCYTEKFGRQSLMVKGGRKSGKQHHANLYQPLFLLEFEIYFKENRDIHLIKEAVRSVPLNRIPYEHNRTMQAIFMAEVLMKVLKEEESNPMLFHFLRSSIEYLDSLPESSPDFHIVFLIQLSRYLGFYPVNNYSDDYPYFDLTSGSFKPVRKDKSVLIDKPTSHLLSEFLKMDYQDMSGSPFNRNLRNRVIQELIRFYRYHIDGMGEIKSIEVFHTLFKS